MTNSVSLNVTAAMKTITGFLTLILGQRVKVHWGQVGAMTAAGEICLPRPKTGEPSEIALLTRLAVHEAGHKDNTDVSVIDGVEKETVTLFNCLEDPRIEAVQMARFKGASLILNRGLDTLFEQLLSKLDPDKEEDKAAILAVTLVTLGLLEMAAHDTVKELGPKLLEKFEPVLGCRVVDAMKSVTSQLPACANSSDVMALSHSLLQALKEPAPEPATDSEGLGDGTDSQEAAQPPQGDEPGPGDDADGSENAPQSETPPETDGGTSDAGNGGGAGGDGAPASGAGDGVDAGSEDVSHEKRDGSPTPHHGTERGIPGQDERTSTQPDSSPIQDPCEAGCDGSSSDRGGSAADDGQGKTGADEPESGPPDSESEAAAGVRACSPGEAQNDRNLPFDLKSLDGMDLGTLLGDAYRAKYGDPDLSADAGGAMQTTVSDDAATALIEEALKGVANSGDSLDSAIDAIICAIADTGEEGQVAAMHKAGAGNSCGVKVDHQPDVRMSGLVSKLSRVFTKVLQGQRRRSVKYGQSGTHVAGDRMWRLKALGDPNVFRARTPRTGIDAAVTILLDRSESMGLDIRDAAEVSVACAQALGRISKVKTSIEMFPGVGVSDSVTVPLLSFGESTRLAVKRASTVSAAGGTPLAEALNEILPVLLYQRTTKHVVILVTDGNPRNRDYARVLISNAQLEGVEFVGIGIGHDCRIEELLQNSIHIDEVSELPDGLEKLFSTRLAGKLMA